MKVLIIGLGSMGKRRIRCLQSLGIDEIYGFDTRSDRSKEVVDKYKINAVDNYSVLLEKNIINAAIISTSPESHMNYAFELVRKNIPCFIEASVTDSHLIKELSEEIKEISIVVAPSCTMKYFKGPKLIKKIIKDKIIGDPIYMTYQTGQYLPDWHPWENVKDFYVSNKITGGCREIVPFELTWLNSLFGNPTPISSIIKNTKNLNIDIDDFYQIHLNYPNNLIANITIEVISRPFALREFRLSGKEGQIVYSQDENCVRYAEKNQKKWITFNLDDGDAEPGYINPERPYIEEINDFLNAVKTRGTKLFPNTLEKDYQVLSLLNELEKISLKIK